MRSPRCCLILALLACTALVSGCKRAHYRVKADRDAYYLAMEKSVATPWELPADYSIQPDPRSRLYDISPPDHPWLPSPYPQLYTYELPDLGYGDGGEQGDGEAPRGATEPLEGGGAEPPVYGPDLDGPEVIPPPPMPLDPDAESLRRLPEPVWGETAARRQRERRPVQLVSWHQPPGENNGMGSQPPPQLGAGNQLGDLPIQPIPAEYWNEIPTSCLARMMEFFSIREEFFLTFGDEPREDLIRRVYLMVIGEEPADEAIREYVTDTRPDAFHRMVQRLLNLPRFGRKLVFPEIIELAFLNSRDYQTQKEVLYRSALALSLERYDYATKFSTSGNGTDVNYTHNRNGGVTVNTLSIPSSLQADAMLATGGTLLASFANNVVLTFNGPQGFASDISSELLASVTQTVFQRDALLNQLVQTERNLVYAARNYIRFRRMFFFQRASSYYDLLISYRNVEINAQNYFLLVRTLNRAELEVQAQIEAAPPRFEVEQIEQDLLARRNLLITTCNTLERSLDRLKLDLGLPTEIPINLDLTELEELTLRDEAEVRGERVRRAIFRVTFEQGKVAPDALDLLNAGVDVADRMSDWFETVRRLGRAAPDSAALLADYEARFRLQVARLEADLVIEELALAERSVPPAPPLQIFERLLGVVNRLLILLDLQLAYGASLGVNPADLQRLNQGRLELLETSEALRDLLAEAIRNADAPLIDRVVAQARDLLEETELLVEEADRLLGIPPGRPTAEEELQQVIRDTSALVELTQRVLGDAGPGLTEIRLNDDAAMLTALAQRLDLMNERGFLADDLRRVKLAADDLKSVLNLSATQRIGTENNRPFDFTYDESQTQLRLSFDAPLNRRAQRNAYRQALIDFQAGRRQLMEAEDNIKFTVRDDLRNLDLARNRYEINVASTALALERVVSTQLQLALTLPNIQTRDFLDASRAYQAALVSVASDRIGYIVARAQLALDLEQIRLDQRGFWPEIYEDDYQPEIDRTFDPTAGNPYGDIPAWLLVSKELRRSNSPPPLHVVEAWLGTAAIECDEPVEGLDGIEVLDPGTLDPPIEPSAVGRE